VWNVIEDNDEVAALAGIKATEDYFRSIGMPVTLTEAVGDKCKDDIDVLTDLCTYYGARTIGAFKVLDADAIKEIYRAAI
jgi:alcohol dehydrogenase YqhD (iron-dependent ADH family)